MMEKSTGPRLIIQMDAAQWVGTREEQQDYVNSSRPELQDELGVLCVLADGMGGLTGGREAAKAVGDTMVGIFHSSSAVEAPEQILLRGCYFSQQEVLRQQQSPNDRGATLIAVLVRDGRCSFISVGDSRIYLFRKGGLILLTRDQNKGARIDAQIGLGRLPEEARTDAKRAALTSFIGMEKLEHPDRSSHSFPLGPGDRIILVSDGVHGTLSEAEMTECLFLPTEQVCEAILNKVVEKKRENQDNSSVALVDIIAAYGEEGIPLV